MRLPFIAAAILINLLPPQPVRAGFPCKADMCDAEGTGCVDGCPRGPNGELIYCAPESVFSCLDRVMGGSCLTDQIGNDGGVYGTCTAEKATRRQAVRCGCVSGAETR